MPEDSIGNRVFNQIGADAFNRAVIGFTELDLVGGSFTWSNEFESQYTKSRIDRAFGSGAWIV